MLLQTILVTSNMQKPVVLVLYPLQRFMARYSY